jgi:FKBP-type peptidyl-prolyl cis-trans isomerase FklB
MIAAFAMASAVFAQTAAKDSIAAAKAAAKAKKVQDAKDLKEFQAKQKADLAAFIEAQKNGKAPIKVEKPVLTNEDDSMAYLYGVIQSNGLHQYIMSQMGVEEAQLPSFVEGLLNRTTADPNDKAATAYSAGTQIGDRILQMTQQLSGDYFAADEGKKIDPALVVNGILAGLLGTNDITPDSAAMIFRPKMIARQEANKEKLYGPNRREGEQFLEENKTKPGVVCTASGLQYKVITMGDGEKPTATQKVKVDYEGHLVDGTVFDSSYKRGQPATFQVNQVIAGWTEALQLMPVGSKWELYIPYQLAYGDRETGREIKPYSALIFTVELKGIEK